MDFDKLKTKVRKFVRERDWEKYHTPKDLAIAISIEANELLEIFQWMRDSESENVKENKQMMERIEGELADILNFCINMANVLELDIPEIVIKKLKEAESKYPKNKYRGVWSKPGE